MAEPRIASHPLDLAARWMPPPKMVGLPLRWCPEVIQREALARILNHLFGTLAEGGEFDYLEDRKLAIELTDMDIRWVLTARGGRLSAVESSQAAETTIRGRAVAFILLAGRLEDPDTLFFQRELEVCGDTALGLTTRNLLDRLPFGELPLGLRIVLNRAARFARRLRAQRAQLSHTAPRQGPGHGNPR
ncbi:MAG: ubiquinone anaerobic biosynthesis accessory factor UbiT [Wenzhouxiangella sp.]